MNNNDKFIQIRNLPDKEEKISSIKKNKLKAYAFVREATLMQIFFDNKDHLGEPKYSGELFCENICNVYELIKHKALLDAINSDYYINNSYLDSSDQETRYTEINPKRIALYNIYIENPEYIEHPQPKNSSIELYRSGPKGYSIYKGERFDLSINQYMVCKFLRKRFQENAQPSSPKLIARECNLKQSYQANEGKHQKFAMSQLFKKYPQFREILQDEDKNYTWK